MGEFIARHVTAITIILALIFGAALVTIGVLNPVGCVADQAACP